MDLFNHFAEQISTHIQRLMTMNKPVQFSISLIVLIAGIVAMEWLLRYARRNIKASKESQRFPDVWKIEYLLLPARLVIIAILLKLMGLPLSISEALSRLLLAAEGLLLSLAAIFAMFYFISILDRFIRHMPASLIEAFPEKNFKGFRRLLKLTILIGVGMVYVHKQQPIFPKWVLQFEWWRYFFIVSLILSVFVFTGLIGKFLTRITLLYKDSDDAARLRMVLRAAVWPARILLAAFVLYAVAGILDLPAWFIQFKDAFLGGLCAAAVFLFVYRLFDIIEYQLNRFVQREDNLLDQNFVQVIGLIARFVIIIVGAVYIIRAVSGRPLSAILAGLGLGGLAIALAAQDTLKNLFGGVMIMLDKPFNVGERIVIDGCDGVVERIGFRSTRVRTLTGHLVTVPNENLAGNRVENIAKRPHIRRLANITVTYDTPVEKVEKALNIIREILDNHEGMHPDFPPRVYFNEFNDTSLNIMMIYWYHPNNYWAFCEFTEKVNLKIMRAFEAEGIEFAFPTSTTYLAQDDRRPLSIHFSGDPQLLPKDSETETA